MSRVVVTYNPINDSWVLTLRRWFRFRRRVTAWGNLELALEDAYKRNQRINYGILQ